MSISPPGKAQFRRNNSGGGVVPQTNRGQDDVTAVQMSSLVMGALGELRVHPVAK